MRQDEATAWFWFASWPLIWEMMDRLAGYMFSVEWHCCEETLYFIWVGHH
jgi:hypothetical protein